MKGSVYQKPSTKKYSPYIYDKETKKKKWGKWHAKKSDAEKELRVMLKDYDAGKITFGRSETFSKIYEEWKTMIAPTVYSSEDSLYTSIGYIENHVLPIFGKKKIGNITAMECQKIFHGMKSKRGGELSDATKRKILGVTNSIFNAASEWGYIGTNPCTGIKLKTPKQKEMEVWDNDQLNYFLELCYGTKYYLPFLILATTGMRRGEVCAIKWKNYDGENLVLTHSMDKSGNLTEMKTDSSHRKIALMKACIVEIEEHRKKQQTIAKEITNKSKIRRITHAEDFICTNEWNSYILPESLTRNFKKIIKRNNKKYAEEKNEKNLMELPVIRLHDLRHGFATFALSSGENVKVISEMLGHAKTSTTHNTYSHATETMQRETANRVEQLMFKEKVVAEKLNKTAEK